MWETIRTDFRFIEKHHIYDKGRIDSIETRRVY